MGARTSQAIDVNSYRFSKQMSLQTITAMSVPFYLPKVSMRPKSKNGERNFGYGYDAFKKPPSI